jgi:hypothetical protein
MHPKRKKLFLALANAERVRDALLQFYGSSVLQSNGYNHRMTVGMEKGKRASDQSDHKGCPFTTADREAVAASFHSV